MITVYPPLLPIGWYSIPCWKFTYLVFRPWWYLSSPSQLDCHVSSLFVEFDCHILYIKSFVLDAICPLILDLIVMYTSSLCWIWLSYTLLIKSFVLDAICPLLLDLIVMYTSTISIHPLLVEFDCRLYITNLIFRPWRYPPSPPWLDCSVYLGPNPIHLLVEFDCRV